MNTEQVKDKLRKLFRVAENDASAEGEIENALRAASILMQAHQIERDDVFEDEDGINVENIQYGKTERYSRYQSITQWEDILCRFICDFVPGTGRYITRGSIRRNQFGRDTGKATKIVFYGPDLDAVFCGEIFDEVVHFITTVATLRYGKALSRGDAAAYAEGFAYGLYNANHKESEKLEEVSKTDCTALVVINRSLAIKEGSKKWLAEQGVRLGKGRGARSQMDKNFDAYRQGKTDGASYQPGTKKKAGLLC